MGVDPGSGQDQVLARDGIGADADHHVCADAGHHVRVAAFADPANLAVTNTDVGFDHALNRVNDGDVGDHQVQHAVVAGQVVVVTHAVAQGFPPSVDRFFAVTAQVLFDFDEQVGIAQADFVAGGGAKQACVFFA